MKHISPPILITLGILALILIAVNPYGNFLETIVASGYLARFLIGLTAFLCLFAAFILVNWVNTRRSGESDARKKHPDLFEEMQSTIRSSLLPLGFHEEEGMGSTNRTKYATYTRGKLVVNLWWDVLDSIFHLDLSSRTKVVDGQKSPIYDLSLEGHIIEADKFKSDSIDKLNKWLVKRKVK